MNDNKQVLKISFSYVCNSKRGVFYWHLIFTVSFIGQWCQKSAQGRTLPDILSVLLNKVNSTVEFQMWKNVALLMVRSTYLLIKNFLCFLAHTQTVFTSSLHRSGVIVVNLTKRSHTLLCCFHCWLCTNKCRPGSWCRWLDLCCTSGDANEQMESNERED